MIPEPYRHSGQAPLGGLAISMTVTMVVSLILGVIYAFVCSWIPIVQLSLLATAAFGAAIGGVAGQCARLGKIRNGAIIPFFSVVGAMLGLWTAWVFDAKARFGVTEFPLLINPAWLLSYVKEFYEVGFWTMGRNGGSVKGLFLLSIWGAETLTILGLSFVTARTIIGSLPFCESCEEWTKKSESFCRFDLPPDDAEVLQHLREGDLSVLRDLTKCVGDKDHSLKLDLCKCGSCEDASYLTIDVLHVTVNKKGETALKLIPIVTNGKLDPDEMVQLQAIRDEAFGSTGDELGEDSGEPDEFDDSGEVDA